MKLSTTMAAALKDLQDAEYYYMAPQFENLRKVYKESKIDGRFTVDGFKRMDSNYSRLTDGTIALNGNSNTIKALEKRGLVEILTLGGYKFDRVKVIGQEPGEKIEELIRVEYKELRTESSGRIASYHNTVFADMDALEVLKTQLENEKDETTDIEILTIETIVPTVWDWGRK